MVYSPILMQQSFPKARTIYFIFNFVGSKLSLSETQRLRKSGNKNKRLRYFSTATNNDPPKQQTEMQMFTTKNAVHGHGGVWHDNGQQQSQGGQAVVQRKVDHVHARLEEAAAADSADVQRLNVIHHEVLSKTFRIRITLNFQNRCLEE